MKKRRLALLSGLLLLIGFLSACTTSATGTPKIQGANQATPTLFFHGFGSSYRAETHMANAAVKAGVTKSVIRLDVSNSGKVTLVGTFKPDDFHPIVEVNYLNSRNPNYHTQGKWAKNVVVKLQQRYGIKKMNMVGHSVGNMAIDFYLLDNAGNTKLPKIEKQVDIAGHFNSILGMDDAPNRIKLKADGEPTKINSHYRELLGLRHDKQLKTLEILNIYGDKNDGTHSDGDVSNASSKSLRYLVPQVKSYQEKRVVGPEAQHSKLHDNPQVDKLLVKFLWGRAS